MVSEELKIMLNAAAKASMSDDRLRDDIEDLKARALRSSWEYDERGSDRKPTTSLKANPNGYSALSSYYEYRLPVGEAECLTVPHLRHMLGLPIREAPSLLSEVKEDHRGKGLLTHPSVSSSSSSSRSTILPTINDFKLDRRMPQRRQPPQMRNCLTRALLDLGLRDVECSWDGITRLSPIPVAERSMSVDQQRESRARLSGIEEVYPKMSISRVWRRSMEGIGRPVPRTSGCLYPTTSDHESSPPSHESTRRALGSGDGSGSVSTAVPQHPSRPSSAASSSVIRRNNAMGTLRPASAPSEGIGPTRRSGADHGTPSGSPASLTGDRATSGRVERVDLTDGEGYKVAGGMRDDPSAPRPDRKPTSRSHNDGQKMVSDILRKAMILKKSQDWDGYPPTVHHTVYDIIEDTIRYHTLATASCRRLTPACHEAMYLLHRELPHLAHRLEASGLCTATGRSVRKDSEPTSGRSLQHSLDDINALVGILRGIPEAGHLNGSGQPHGEHHPRNLDMLEYKIELMRQMLKQGSHHRRRRRRR